MSKRRNESGGSKDKRRKEDNEESTLFQDKDHHNSTLSTMLQSREEGELIDVTVVAGKARFDAHRLVLKSAIPYFQAMFSQGFLEKKERIIDLKENVVDESVFEDLMRYAYTGQVKITASNVQNLLIGANFLSITSVVSACEEFLQTSITSKNVLEIIELAETVSATSLVSAAQTFIENNVEPVIQSDKFLNTSFQFMLNLVKNDNLNVNEELVYEAVMKWIKNDETNRSCYLTQLLAEIRLPMLSLEYLCENVQSQEMIRSNLECRDLVDDALKYKIVPKRRCLLSNINSKSRGVGLIYSVGGFHDGTALDTVEIYDPLADKWSNSQLPFSIMTNWI